MPIVTLGNSFLVVAKFNVTVYEKCCSEIRKQVIEVKVLKNTLMIKWLTLWEKIKIKMKIKTPMKDTYLSLYKGIVCKLFFWNQT